ncbi:hypothetical protein IEQ34_015833 [Dendrobium chrysotoxum]|uniref:Uncharacterized protein n=1 Tax=Dendrobium chrysotoxum TaxID=161865 RepID=A0AAV7GH70_DENCH|nr:hypothetical protein IEQ34_015833 [Dendrobium chrysotoxum]
MGDHTSTKIPLAKENRPVVQSEGPKKAKKVAKDNDVASTITSDSLIIFRKKFHFPNDLVIKVTEKYDRACSPLLEFLTSHIDHNGIDRVFKDRYAVLSLECLFWMDKIQEARDYIYDMEVNALELKCMEEGFIRSFLKGVRLVQHKTRAEIEGLTLSQTSGDSSSDSDGNEIECELQKAFALEEDDDIEIL